MRDYTKDTYSNTTPNRQLFKFRDQALGFGLKVSGLRLWGFRFGVSLLRLRLEGVRFKVWAKGCKVYTGGCGLRFRVWGSRFAWLRYVSKLCLLFV